MFSWLARMANFCLRPMRRYNRMNDEDDDDNETNNTSTTTDSLLWSRDLERHSLGDFSISVVQANETIEDHSQIETYNNGSLFVGVYDGHGGPEASRYISDHLFSHLLRVSKGEGEITEDSIRAAYSATEEGFLTLVRRTGSLKPLIAAVGSCCLVGLIWKGTLLIANVGDSRAVLASSHNNKIVAEQLTRDHNAALEEVRHELKSLHPDDPDIVVLKHGVWRVKGIIQVSRSIGDAYLKRPEFSLDLSFPRFHVPERLRRPVLLAEPCVYTRVLQRSDKFVIFASDGLWEQMSNQQAVDIVNKHPRPGIARRLVRRAMTIAAKKREMRYEDLTKVERGVRRYFHDDITVVVIFIDNELLMVEKATVPELSIKGFSNTVGPSKFSIFFS